jgi:hypothetical protein
MKIDFNNILHLTSLLFLTNTCTALYKKYYVYAFLFFCLTITSLLYHNKFQYVYHTEYKLVDTFFVYCIVLYGGYILYTKINKNILMTLFIITAFLGCIYLYIYGYYKQNYCFHPHENLACQYHALLHLCVTLGHHFIIFM